MALRLPRLPSQQPAWNIFQRWWQSVVEAIESAFNQLQATVDAVAAAQDAADSANAAAVVAQDAAEAAQAASDGIAGNDALSKSYVDGLTITADDFSGAGRILISAHTRYYGDGTNVAVSGGSLTGLAYDVPVYVYYDQASRAGGAVTYVASLVVVGNGTSPNRHFVGSVRTPVAAAPPNDGFGAVPPGVVIP
jgi:hypothetical protein